MTTENTEEIKKDKIIEHLLNGKIVVIVPGDFENTTVPLFCPVCKFPMKTSDDSATYRKYKCCFKCECYRAHEIKDHSSEEWKEYIENRRLLSKTIINFR